VGGNLLFGSMPDQRGEMQSELARRVHQNKLAASSTAGLGSIFTAIGDRHVKEGGRIALVLPAAIATGIAWEKTRDLINGSYVLETMIASHDPARWNFSENTDLSELLLIARKRVRSSETDERVAPEPTQFINLWQNPKTTAHALAAGDSITRGAAAPIGDVENLRHGISEILIGSQKFGEMLEIPWGDVRNAPWIGCAFAQSSLIRTAWFLRQGKLYRPGHNEVFDLPVRRLGDVAVLGPDRRDIADGFTLSAARSRYPAFWGHSADEVCTIEISSNKYLQPRAKAARGRPLRDAALLWSRAGTVMISERSWLNTQRTLAVRLPRPALSNVWWPVRLKKPNVEAEKTLALWLNSTLGLLTSLAHRIPTRGAWVQFKKPTIENLPILDVTALSSKQLRQLAGAYDVVARKEIGPFVHMAEDSVRQDIDDAFATILGLPSLDELRAELAAEPIISLQNIDVEEKEVPPETEIQFELL
jgi:hypothetical protein